LIKQFTFIAFSLAASIKSFAYTIDEKRQDLINNQTNLEFIDYSKKNDEIGALYKELEDKYQSSAKVLLSNSDEATFTILTAEIEDLKNEISALETSWKEAQTIDYNKDDDNFGIWELGEITISKLMVEYGSSESLYVIPPEVASLKLSLHCLLTIPKESWPKMIDLILTHNNIGVKKLNPFVKQLYLLKEDYTNVDTVTSDIKHLNVISDTSRVIFIYSPPVENIKTAFYFLDKFKNVKTTYIYQVGSKIAIVGLVKDVQTLVALAENVWDEHEQRVSKIISPQKISSEDAVKLLKSYFGGLTDYSKPMMPMKGGNGLSAFTLKGENSLILIGSKEIVEQAETVLRQTEAGVNDPSEVTLYWHTCNHSKPVEVAEILSKVYDSLISFSISDSKGSSGTQMGEFTPSSPANPYPYPQPPSSQGFEKSLKLDKKDSKEHFFPFPASSSILMVVRKDTLSRIKDILKKLDTPKKMVEIEVLLCERKIGNTANSGVNLLKLADAATGSTATKIAYDAPSAAHGILSFLFSRGKDSNRHIPAMDIGYSFLLSQEDIIVTASPSTTTLNQMSTTIAVTDQISINNGAVISGDHDKKVNSYTREDYGITVTITPTIHDEGIDNPNGEIFITLENDISFDTIGSSDNDRPSVHKKHITNTVRIPDGQTVIIGGLRSTTNIEKSSKIPFLGEIPGFAKIFGTNSTSTNNTEMFIFIKPKVIADPSTDLLRIREARLKKRPGDTEMLLGKINESRRSEEKFRFQDSVNLLFGSGNSYEQTL